MAAFVSGFSFEKLPPEVVKQSKLMILDIIGCAFSGVSADRGALSKKVVESFGGNQEATIIGNREKISCLNAAYANANMASALDNEETFANLSHFSSNTVFAALGLGERLKASGKELITAVAVGYETGARVSLSTGFWGGKIVEGKIVPYRDRAVGWAAPVSMGGVAAASSILKLNKEQIVNAMGLQGHFAPMPTQHVWWDSRSTLNTSLKYCDNGWMALGAVMAASLAKEGFTSFPTGILDGDRGFWKICGFDKCDFEVMIEKLGEKWWILNTSFKPWPSCRIQHHAQTAIGRIIDNHNIEPNEVDKVTIKRGSLTRHWFYNQEPSGPVEAQFSLPHSIAMMFYKIPPGPDWYRPEVMGNEQIKKFRKKVNIEFTPDSLPAEIVEQLAEPPGIFRAVPTLVEVVARGETFRESLKYAKGDPWSPEAMMTEEELKEKFRVNAYSTFPVSVVWRQQVERIIETLFSLEKLADIRDLTSLLTL